MANNEIYYRVVNFLITTFNRFSLYPPNHPVVKSALKDTYSAFQEALAAQKDFTFSISSENKILLEGVGVFDRPSKLQDDFISRFKGLEVLSVTFSQGLTPEEVELFLKILLMKAEDAQGQGGIIKVLADKGITHIKPNLFSYVKVEKDKKVAIVETEALKPEELDRQVTSFLRGGLDETTSRSLGEKLFHHFLDHPEGFIAALKTMNVDSVKLSAMLDLIGGAGVTQAKGQDVPSRLAMVKSAKKFFSKIQKSVPAQNKAQSSQMMSIIEEKGSHYIEAMLADAAGTEYLENKSWTATLKAIVKDLFSFPEKKGDVVNLLKEKLSGAGLSDSEVAGFLSKAEEQMGQEPVKRQLKPAPEELTGLKDENAQLKAQVAQLQEAQKGSAGLVEILKKENRRILEEKQRISNVIRNMAEGIVVVDSEGKILMINPVAERLLNVTLQDALGKSLQECVKDEHTLALAKNLVPNSEGIITNEIELVGANESTRRIVKTSSAMVQNPDGGLVGMVTVLNDITRQKELEKLKSDFVANVTHELRTPLVIIQQNLAVLTESVTGKLDEDQKRFFNNAASNAERLRSLINDMLDMASLEAGKFKLHPAMADINEAVNTTVSFLERWAINKHITLQRQLLPNKTELFIDKDRIAQVITNLVSNALKFTPEGGRISVCLSERAPDTYFNCEAIEISVTDTGCGIEAKDLEKIFNKFEQVQRSQPAEARGTGLGLSIVKEIVSMHGGRVRVTSEVGKGSTFSFILPKSHGEQ